MEKFITDSWRANNFPITYIINMMSSLPQCMHKSLLYLKSIHYKTKHTEYTGYALGSPGFHMGLLETHFHISFRYEVVDVSKVSDLKKDTSGGM